MKAMFARGLESKRKEKTWKGAPGISSPQNERSTFEISTEATALFAARSDLFVLPHNPRFYALVPNILRVSAIYEVWSVMFTFPLVENQFSNETRHLSESRSGESAGI